MIPYARSYTATVSGATLRTVKCESCGIEYGYVLRREASGSGTSVLFLDNAGAEQRANQAAQQQLAQALNAGVGLVPCPHCGWCQRNMFSLARRLHHPGLKLLSIGLLGLAGVMFIAALVTGSMLVSQLAIVPLASGDASAEQLKGPTDPISVFWVGLLGVVVAGLGLFAFSIQKSNEAKKVVAAQQNQFLAPFQAHLNEYLPVNPPPRPVPGLLKGKFILVNYSKRGLDGLNFSLPPHLRPSKPEDVGTIVWLAWGEEIVGKYDHNTFGCVVTCEVTVIDKADGQVVHQQSFEGGQPPQQTKEHNRKLYGSAPNAAIMAWLGSLPREEAKRP